MAAIISTYLKMDKKRQLTITSCFEKKRKKDNVVTESSQLLEAEGEKSISPVQPASSYVDQVFQPQYNKNDIAQFVAKKKKNLQLTNEDKKAILMELHIDDCTKFPQTEFGKKKRSFKVKLFKQVPNINDLYTLFNKIYPGRNVDSLAKYISLADIFGISRQSILQGLFCKQRPAGWKKTTRNAHLSSPRIWKLATCIGLFYRTSE